MTPEQLHDHMRTQMEQIVRERLGAGYEPEYIRSLADDFVAVADWYSEALIKALA